MESPNNTTSIVPSPEENGAGRKVFDGKDQKDVVSKLEAAFASGATDKEACVYAGISRSALFRYEEENPEFRNRKLQLKAYPVLQARQTVVKAITTDPNLAFKYLERKLPNEFGAKVKVEGGGGEQPATNVSFISIANLDDESRRVIKERVGESVLWLEGEIQRRRSGLPARDGDAEGKDTQ